MEENLKPEILTVIEELVASSACPFIVFDGDGIYENLKAFSSTWKRQFSNVEVAYSFKTNSLKFITRIMQGFGTSAEVVSGAELEIALSDGFLAKDIIFNGPVKPVEELRKALELGVRVNVDSLREIQDLEQLSKHLPNIRFKVGIRLAGYTKHGTRSRFGLDESELSQAMDYFRQMGIGVSGLHLHCGSNLTSIEPLEKSLDHYERTIRDFLNKAREPVWIDLGGGYPAQTCGSDHAPRIADFAELTSKKLASFGFDDKVNTVIVEPGRCFVEDFAWLVTRAHSVKIRGMKVLVTLDAGTNLTKSIGSWEHPFYFLSPPSNSQSSTCDFLGAMCYESDVFLRGIELPFMPSAGDVVAFGGVGGYDIPSTNPWIRPLPAVFATAGGLTVPVRSMGEAQDLRLRQDELPSEP